MSAPDQGPGTVYLAPGEPGDPKGAQIGTQGQPGALLRVHAGCGEPVKVIGHILCPVHGALHVYEVSTVRKV